MERDLVPTPEPDAAPAPAARGTRRRRWLLLALVLGGFAWLLHEPTTPIVIVGAGAGTYDLLSYTRHTSYLTDLHGKRTVDTSLQVIYYANASGDDAMRAEARTIAPALWPFADTAGLHTLRLKPSRPLFLRAFPIAKISYDVTYERGRDGAWAEAVGQ